MKKIMIVAAVFAAFAMTSCNKCTSCKVTTSGKDLGKYEKTFGSSSSDSQMSVEDCKELKKQAQEYVEETNKLFDKLGVDGKLSFHCN